MDRATAGLEYTGPVLGLTRRLLLNLHRVRRGRLPRRLRLPRRRIIITARAT